MGGDAIAPHCVCLLVTQRRGLLRLVEEPVAGRGSDQRRNNGADSGDNAIELLHRCASFLKNLGKSFSLLSRMAPNGVSVRDCQAVPNKRLVP